MIEIIIALVTGGFSVVAVLLSNRAANNKMVNSMKTSQAVTDEKLEELTREVREHNNFAKRVPVLEEKMYYMEKQILDLQALHKRQ